MSHEQNTKLSEMTLRELCSVMYGSTNSVAVNSMKSGFRAGYAVGWDAQEIEIKK